MQELDDEVLVAVELVCLSTCLCSIPTIFACEWCWLRVASVYHNELLLFFYIPFISLPTRFFCIF